MRPVRVGRPLMLNGWVNLSTVRNRVARARGHARWPDNIPDWLDKYAPGRSFVDVGCMWKINGEIAFEAEARGAKPVTGLDVVPPTDECMAAYSRRNSEARFLVGDLHDPTVLNEVGVHDVVWCGGVLYHVPNPLLALQRLRSITRQYLILATMTIPEVPGFPQSCIFYPRLSDPARLALAAPISGVADGLTTRFDPALDYSNWWWGISRSALRSMLDASGFKVVEEGGRGNIFHTSLVCEATDGAWWSSVKQSAPGASTVAQLS